MEKLKYLWHKFLYVVGIMVIIIAVYGAYHDQYGFKIPEANYVSVCDGKKVVSSIKTQCTKMDGVRNDRPIYAEIITDVYSIRDVYKTTVYRRFCFPQGGRSVQFVLREFIFAIIIDEAYKIGDDNRGLLLQQIIEWGMSINNNLRLVFISPFTANPERLLEDVDHVEQSSCVKGDELTVNQNVLWLEQKPNSSKQWTLKLISDNQEYFLNNISLKSAPSTDLKRIAYVVDALTHNENMITIGNIIYVNGAADAEKVAQLIYDLLGEDNNKNDKALSYIFEYMINDDLDKEQCLSWFDNNPDWINYDLPEKIKQEIVLILAQYNNS